MRFGVILFLFFVGYSSLSYGHKNSTPVQKRSLIIKDGEFFPQKLIIFENETLHVMVGNFMGHSSCIANNQLDIFLNVSPGSVVEKYINFDKTGAYSFGCPGLKGELIVHVKEKPILSPSTVNGVARTPASVDPGVWVPRDEPVNGLGERW